MSQKRVGRPMKNNNKVEVNSLIVEFLSKKKNDYGAEICFMKVVDKEGKKKMKPITVLDDEGIRMPYWQTDKLEMILKVKDKFIGSIEPLEQGRLYSIDAEFESYCIEKENETPIKGYYMKVPQMRAIIEIDSD
jgi:hypothetical protein